MLPHLCLSMQSAGSHKLCPVQEVSHLRATAAINQSTTLLQALLGTNEKSNRKCLCFRSISSAINGRLSNSVRKLRCLIEQINSKQLPFHLQFIYSNSNSNLGKNSHNRYIVTKQMAFTLNSVIKKQQILLHGYQARHLKFIPKVNCT